MSVTKIPDGVRANVDVTSDIEGSRIDHQIWEVNSKGIYQIAVGNPSITYNPPQPVILFPPTAERRFSWKGTGISPVGKEGSSVLNSVIRAMQSVDASTGQYPAICVETKGTFVSDKTNGVVSSLAYWSPKVGLVRYVQTAIVGNNAVIQTLRLKASTLR